MAAGDLKVIRTFATPFYTETVPLDGINYRLYFGYNQREDTWYLSIANDLGTDLLNGIKLVCGIDLLKRWHYIEGLPAGQLACISLSGTDDSPPGLNDLAAGARCQLTYVATV